MRNMSKALGLLALLRKLRRDEDGVILPYVTLLVVVMVGMIGLVLDGGALFHLNSDLHAPHFFDAAHLASYHQRPT